MNIIKDLMSIFKQDKDSERPSMFENRLDFAIIKVTNIKSGNFHFILSYNIFESYRYNKKFWDDLSNKVFKTQVDALQYVKDKFPNGSISKIMNEYYIEDIKNSL